MPECCDSVVRVKTFARTNKIQVCSFYKLLKINLRMTDLDLIFQINQTIKDVGLEDQKDTFAKDLSGGQKRKLSVAISLIGDPKVARSVYTVNQFLFVCKKFFAIFARASFLRIFLAADQLAHSCNIKEEWIGLCRENLSPRSNSSQFNCEIKSSRIIVCLQYSFTIRVHV